MKSDIQSSEIAAAVRVDIIAQVQASFGARNGSPPASSRTPAKTVARKSGGRRQTLDDATLTRVLKVIQDNPGLRSEEIYQKVPLAPEQAKKALAKLRADRRVKTKGEKRATTYAAA